MSTKILAGIYTGDLWVSKTDAGTFHGIIAFDKHPSAPKAIRIDGVCPKKASYKELVGSCVEAFSEKYPVPLLIIDYPKEHRSFFSRLFRR